MRWGKLRLKKGKVCSVVWEDEGRTNRKPGIISYKCIIPWNKVENDSDFNDALRASGYYNVREDRVVFTLMGER